MPWTLSRHWESRHVRTWATKETRKVLSKHYLIGGKWQKSMSTCARKISLHGVNVPKDANNLAELEQKRLPVISAPGGVNRDQEFAVAIEVGKYKKHPNEAAHFIEWVKLYSGDTFLFRAHLSGSLSEPKITIPVKLTHAHGPLKTWSKCNIHGLWEGKKDIEVEE